LAWFPLTQELVSILFISRNREQLGQFSEEEVREGLQTGRFLGSDLAWKEGMAEWKPLSTFGLTGAVTGLASGEVVPAGEGWPVWENAAKVGWFTAWWQTTSEALFSPIQSFSKMRTTGGYGQPLIYAMVGGALGSITSSLFQGVISLFTSASAGGEEAAVGMAAMLCAIPLGLVMGLVFAAVAMLVAVFVGGGIVHLMLMLMGGANKGFEATCRAVAYSGGAINAMMVVPILGWLAAMTWGWVVYVVAIKEAQKTDYLRATMAVLIPVVVCCGVFVAIIAAFAAVIMEAIKMN
jgi:hypothetical protein